MARTECDVLIVGGGPTGVAAAWSAAESGLSTIIVDARDGIVADMDRGRAVAIMAGTRDRLIDLDLWPALADVALPIHRVRIQASQSGHEHLYQAHDLGRSLLFHGIDYGTLRARIARKLRSTGLLRHFRRRRLAHLHLDAGWRRAGLDDGTEIRARLVIGADGRRSTVREAVGLTARRSEFPQTAVIFGVEGDLLEPGTVLERLTLEGPISVLPTGAGRFAVTWVDSTTAALRRRALPARDFLAEFAAALELPAAASARLATPVTLQRLGLSHADRYVAPRLVLVGDAAHGGHPVHAQGFNMAIGDVHELAMLWRVEGRGFAGAEALARFQRSRRMSNAARLGFTDVMNRLFEASNAPFAFMQGTMASSILAHATGTLPAVGRHDDDHLIG